MDIRETSLLFSETEGEGPISASTTLSFPRPVRKVAAGVSGYTARFEDDVDRPFGRLEIEVGVSVDALLLAVHLEGHEPPRVDRPTVRS